MKFVLYSGSYSINSLGATKSLCTMILREVRNMGYQVTWVGRGFLEDNENIETHTLSHSKLSDLFIRVKNKILRTVFGFSPNDIALREFAHYDKIVQKKIDRGHIKVDSQTVFMGLSGMSLFAFEAAQKKGAFNVLACQWLHPKSHNALLEKEYKDLNIPATPIPPGRIVRQLAEIELVDKVWIFSDFAEQSFLSVGFPKEKLINSPLGVDFKYFEKLLKSYKKVENQKNILFVGNVNPEKGVHTLLKAVLNLEIDLSNVNLIFNGVVAKYFKPLFDDYQMKLEAKGVKVTVEPGIPFDNFLRSSIFVLPSAHDSFGLVVLEAMASGLPVIVSSQVGAKDCVEVGKNGDIFEVSNAEELKAKLHTLLINDELAIEWGRNSIEIAKRYDWSISMKNLINKIEAESKRFSTEKVKSI